MTPEDKTTCHGFISSIRAKVQNNIDTGNLDEAQMQFNTDLLMSLTDIDSQIDAS